MSPEEMSINQREHFEEVAAEVEDLVRRNISDTITLVMAAHMEGASIPDIAFVTRFFFKDGDTYVTTKVFTKGAPYNIKAQG